MKHRRLRGFTFVETMVAIVILLTLVGFAGVGVSRSIQNSKMDQTALAVKTAVSDLEIYITERGPLRALDGESSADTAKRFFNDFNTNFSSMSYDTNTLITSSQSFTADTSVKTDAWGSHYRLYYSWANEMFVVASAGTDMKFDFQTSKDAAKMDDLFAAVVGK